MWLQLSFFALVLVQERLFVAGEIYYTKGAPHVKLTNGGLISGVVKFSRDGRPYNAFKGIPYATVPERFMESKLVTKPTWEGTFNAVKPGLLCPQLLFNVPSDLLGDDCLGINIYVPMTDNGPGDKGYPIMFWLHGGGYIMGSGNDDPSYFMDEDVILVTINYRLGVFGFLSTEDNVVPGNNGLKDMVVALKWVQENIKKFGGNPSKVTIFGVSAGASAVHYLLLSPTANGLFHGAISLSGTALSMWAYDPNPRQNAVDLATYLKCPTTAAEPSEISSEEILACLKGKSTAELAMAQVAYKPSWPSNIRTFTFVPTKEPQSTLNPFLTKPPMLVISESGNDLPDVPWVLGCTESEGAWLSAKVLSIPERLNEINTDWEYIAPFSMDYDKYVSKEEQHKISEKLKNFYFNKNDISKESRQSLSNLYSDAMFLHGAYKAVMMSRKSSKSPTYLYSYTYRGPSIVARYINATTEETEALKEHATHGDDIVTLFDLGSFFPDMAGAVKPDSPDEKFSKNVISLLASFAVNGEPKHVWGNEKSNEWKALSNEQIIGQSPLTWYSVNANPASVEVEKSVIDRMQLWDELWSQHLTPALLAKEKSTL